MATKPRVPPTNTPPKPDPPALRVSQVTIIVGLIDQYDAPRHILDDQGQVRQFQFFGDETGSSIEKATQFLATVPAMVAQPPSTPDDQPEPAHG